MKRRILAVAAAAAMLPGVARAQTPRISLGTVTSEQSCTTYQLSAGSSALVANAYGIAAMSSWRTWLQRDCVANFATLRASLTAALASSGKLTVVPRGGYTLSAVVSAVGSRSANVSGQDMQMSGEQSTVSMSLTLRDPAGRAVGGGLVTRSVETSGSITTNAFATSGGRDGQAMYNALEQGLAAQAARFAAMKVAPMRVIDDSADGIRLDYGSPLLTLGTMIQVQTPTGRFARYRVTAAGQGVSTAESDGAPTPVPPGSLAIVIEEDDPAANARTMRRIDLP